MIDRQRRDWPAIAEKFAALLPRDRLDPAVLAWTSRSSRRVRWSVALSGGPDSVALLLLVWAHWPERRRTLRALHFDHRLRGRESRADAEFCRRVCAALGVTYLTGRWEGNHRGASEAEARAARMRFLEAHARVVFLGHQQDDIAETLLMRMARGSGTGGLAAPRPVQEQARGRVHLRPLLTCRKEMILAALREAGATWREDSSNAAGAYFRNRIRRDVIPAWIDAAQRDAMAGAARTRLLLEEDDRALESWLEALNPVDRKGQLDVAALAGKPRALLRRALHRWLLAQSQAGELSRQAFESLLAAVEKRGATRHSLGRHGFAVTDGRRLWFELAREPRRKIRGQSN